MGHVSIRYDPEADAAYLRMADEDRDARVAWTYCCDPIEVSGMINLDFDHDGRLIGVDVMDASKKLPPELLSEHEPRPLGTDQ